MKSTNESITNLSIIIPHYNMPQMLKRLLNSINVRQDVEIIVVDDKSDKNCLDECKEIVDRTDLIFLKNETGKKGAGVCRNIGLAHATGKWVLFSDSDDWFDELYYEKVSKYFNTEFDVVFFEAISKNLGNNQLRYENQVDRFVNKKIFSDYLSENAFDKRQAEIELRYKVAVPWGKLISKKIIDDNNIYFDELISGNDLGFSYRLGYYAKNIYVDENVIYYYAYRTDSISHSFTEDSYWDRVTAHGWKNEFLIHNLSVEEFKSIPSSLRYLIKQCIFCDGGFKICAKTILYLKKTGDIATYFMIIRWIIEFTAERFYKKYVRRLL